MTSTRKTQREITSILLLLFEKFSGNQRVVLIRYLRLITPISVFRKLRLSLALSVALFHLLSIGSSHGQIEIGSPINPVGSGARALGMGNAFIAVADDATAASWNPAGLIQLQTSELSFALESLVRDEELALSSNPKTTDGDVLAIEDFNYASMVYPFFFRTSMVFSLNYLKLFRFDKDVEFRVDSPGISEVIFELDFSQDGSFSVLAPAYAVFITPKLSLGLTVNVWDHSLTGSSAYSKQQIIDTTFVLPNSTGEIHRVEKERFEIEDGISFVIGGLYRFNETFSVGLVIKPAFTLDIDHTFSTTEIESGEPSSPPGEPRRLNAELEFPLIVGLGATWRPLDPFTVSLDITWSDWSNYVFVEGGEETNPISGLAVDNGKLDDIFTVRMGSEYLLIRDSCLIPFRWGIGYDPAPAVGETDDFYTVSMGTGLQVGRYNFDVAYEYRWGNNVNRDIFQGIDASQDIRQHRVLASFIYYF